jgi:hypothetical protein
MTPCDRPQFPRECSPCSGASSVPGRSRRSLPSTASLIPCPESIRRGPGEFDSIAFDEVAVLFAPETLQVLADSNCDNALTLLTGPRSKVAQVFVSPNFHPTFGADGTLFRCRLRPRVPHVPPVHGDPRSSWLRPIPGSPSMTSRTGSGICSPLPRNCS